MGLDSLMHAFVGIIFLNNKFYCMKQSMPTSIKLLVVSSVSPLLVKKIKVKNKWVLQLNSICVKQQGEYWIFADTYIYMF